MKKSHNPKRALEQPMIEGRTYLAEIIECPWAYRKIKGCKSTKGRVVRATLGRVVSIEWENGGTNGTDRSHIRIIGEAPSTSAQAGKGNT